MIRELCRLPTRDTSSQRPAARMGRQPAAENRPAAGELSRPRRRGRSEDRRGGQHPAEEVVRGARRRAATSARAAPAVGAGAHHRAGEAVGGRPEGAAEPEDEGGRGRATRESINARSRRTTGAPRRRTSPSVLESDRWIGMMELSVGMSKPIPTASIVAVAPGTYEIEPSEKSFANSFLYMYQLAG